MSLRGRLFGLIGVFCLVFITFAAVAFTSLRTIAINSGAYDEIIAGKDVVADVLPPPLYIIESYLLVHRMLEASSTAEVNALVDGSRRLRAEYDVRHTLWNETMPAGVLRTHLVDESYRPAIAFFDARDRDFIPAIVAGDRERARALLQNLLRPLYEQHRAAVDATVVEANRLNSLAEERAAQMLLFSNTAMVVLGLLALAVVIALFLLFDRIARKLTDDMRAAAEAAQRVASGDLTVKIGATGDDESGRLLAAIGQMALNLAQLVSRAQRASLDLLSTAAELAATSREQDAAIAGFGASTNEIAAAVTEISATSRELVSTMNDVSRVATDAATLAANGRSGLDRMDATMAQLTRSTASVTARLSSIQEKAADINVVVTTITKVADQTNLLSINAAIEAEKAGEYGLGFLVLAREIRRLADQTAVATLDIEHIVKQMQSAVTAGVMEMDRFNADVRGGVSTVAQVGTQLGDIISQVSSLAERFDFVNEGMRSQSEGAKQIKDAMVLLTDGARQTTASLGEFRMVTESLRESATGLRSSIAGFRVEE